MDAETRAALEASIRHWEENVAAETPDMVSIKASDCALCSLFIDLRKACDGCPVKEATGLRYCDGTPYEKAVDALRGWRVWQADTHRSFWRIGAQDEVDFLKSLLPKDENNDAR